MVINTDASIPTLNPGFFVIFLFLDVVFDFDFVFSFAIILHLLIPKADMIFRHNYRIILSLQFYATDACIEIADYNFITKHII